MTTIKLRRGLSTAFSTNNPVLAAGEPAFATDTGILKIGDGTTAYNSLPSIGASPDLSNYVQKTDYASTSAAGVIKVDGSTINIDANGVISSSGSAPSNMVTTDTNQTITGYKRFNDGITIVQDGLVSPTISMSDGTTSATALRLQFGDTPLLTLTGAPNIDITASGKLAFSGNPTNVVRNRAGVEYEMLDTSMVDGTTITYNSSTGKISATSSTPSNMVTTDTAQTITGIKTFKSSTAPAQYDYTGAIKGFTTTADGSCNFYVGVTDNSYNRSGIVLTRSENKYMGLMIGSTVQNALTNSNSVRFTGTPTGSGSIWGGTRMTITGGSTSLLLNNDGFKVNSNPVLDSSCVDGTTITYNSTTGKISASGGGGASIDDTQISSTTTYSSQKITNTFTASTDIRNIVKLTQAQYDALTTKDANTFYIIVAASS